MRPKFWLARAKQGGAPRSLELYAGGRPWVGSDGHWEVGRDCKFVGLLDLEVCCGFSVEPGQCVRAEIGLMQRVGDGVKTTGASR